MVPGIASKWDLSDDGLPWTFTIRKGVKFHDGSELTRRTSSGPWSITMAPGPMITAYLPQGSQNTWID